MFYKLIKMILLAAATVSLVMVFGLTSGWFGLQKVPFVLQLCIVTTGLFVFYKTRKTPVQQNWMRMPAFVAHVLVLPVSVLMAWAVGNEGLAQGYWFMFNLVMVVLLGISWLLVLANLPLPVLSRLALVMASAVYLTLLCLHMSGIFKNGKIIFLFGILLFLVTILVVFLGIKKPVRAEEESPAEAPPAGE